MIDWFTKEIKVGDKVVYNAYRKTRAEFVIGEVLSIAEKMVKIRTRCRYPEEKFVYPDHLIVVDERTFEYYVSKYGY